MRTATVDIDTLARAIYSNTQASEQEARAFIETSLVVSPSVHRQASAEGSPIDMVLHCPKCGMQHLDGDESKELFIGGTLESGTVRVGWDNPPHRSHLCHGCGHIWRPADVPTNGVAAVKTKGQADSAIATPATQIRQASAGHDEVALIEKAAIRVGITSLMNQGAASCVYSEGCSGVTQEHLIAFAREIAMHCVAALSTAAPESGWIDVKERMPPAISHIIAHGRQYGDLNRKRPLVYVTYTGTRVRETVEDEEITHWQPLPAAPTAGETL